MSSEILCNNEIPCLVGQGNIISKFWQTNINWPNLKSLFVVLKIWKLPTSYGDRKLTSLFSFLKKNCISWYFFVYFGQCNLWQQKHIKKLLDCNPGATLTESITDFWSSEVLHIQRSDVIMDKWGKEMCQKW